MRNLILILLISIATSARGNPWDDGTAAGQSVLGQSAGSVTQSNVDNIGSTAPVGNTVTNLQATFAASNAGNVGLVSDGNTKIANCAAYVPSPSTPETNAECAAVNQLAKNPGLITQATTSFPNMKTDPIVTDPNNMYNQGLASLSNSATAPSTAIGGGLPPSTTTPGSGSCVAAGTPITYTQETCTRASVPSTQECQIQLLDSITNVPTCNISGTVYADAMPSGGGSSYADQWGRPLPINAQYELGFSCPANTGTASGQGIVTFAPTTIYNTQSYIQGTVYWWPGTWGIYGYGPTSVSFTPGVAQTWGPFNQGNGSGFGLTMAGTQSSLYYDGTNWFTTETHPSCYLWSNCAQIQVPDYSFCAPGYTYVPPQYSKYGAKYQTAPGYCSATPPVTPTYSCTIDRRYGYWILSGARCYKNRYQYMAANATCPSGYTLVGSVCEAPATPAPPDYYIPNVHPPIDNGVRHFRQVNGTYSGIVGNAQTLTETTSNSCSQYQTATSTPTSNPATAVNGSYVCPTGTTVSGSNCI